MRRVKNEEARQEARETAYSRAGLGDTKAARLPRLLLQETIYLLANFLFPAAECEMALQAAAAWLVASVGILGGGFQSVFAAKRIKGFHAAASSSVGALLIRHCLRVTRMSSYLTSPHPFLYPSISAFPVPRTSIDSQGTGLSLAIQPA